MPLVTLNDACLAFGHVALLDHAYLVLEPGERIGLMKFSSRMDVIVPPEVEVLVRPGERVWGGITYTKREKVIDFGPIQATAEKRETVPFPPVLGAICLVGGIVLVMVGGRKA